MNNEQMEKDLKHEIMELEQQLKDMKEKYKHLKFINANGRYFLCETGDIHELIPTVNNEFWEKAVKQNNTFKTIKDAEKERDRRALLYEFNQFRDECNKGKKINWNMWTSKYYIGINGTVIDWYLSTVVNPLSCFGYFHKKEHCLEAIEKFGDRIKKLYID